MSRIIRVFTNADLRCGHDGLASLARKHAHDPRTLLPGEFFIFLNTQKTKFKLMAAHDVIAYYRSPGNRRIELAALQYIPKVFESRGSLKMNDALKELFNKKLRT